MSFLPVFTIIYTLSIYLVSRIAFSIMKSEKKGFIIYIIRKTATSFTDTHFSKLAALSFAEMESYSSPMLEKVCTHIYSYNIII